MSLHHNSSTLYLDVKSRGVVLYQIALLLAVVSLDLKLVCEFYESLSEEWSTATQREEQRLRTSPRVTILVGAK